MEILIGDAVNKKYAKTIQRFRRQHFGELEGEPNPDQGFYYKEKILDQETSYIFF